MRRFRGEVEVEAASEREAKNKATRMGFNFFDSEITDMTAEKVVSNDPMSVIERLERWAKGDTCDNCPACDDTVFQAAEMLRKAYLDEDGPRTNIVTELCPHCEREVEMFWDTDVNGFKAFCPYCGRELVDLSRENTDRKIREVKRAQSETMSAPKKVGLVVVVTLLVLFLLLAFAVFLNIPEEMNAAGTQREMDRLSGDMQKAYEKEEWDKLEQYLIDECEVYLESPDYFLYRTAWFLHTYPSLFDEAYQAHDTEEMLFIYEIMAEDYDMRADDIFFSVYGTDEEIEAALAKEVERETEIMMEEGLEDEMYKLRR